MAPRLFLMDGSGYIFRAFFAVPPLSTRQGLPTNAILGFTTALLKLLKEEPDGLVVAFEAGGPTFRHEIFPEYKANRPPVPEDLRTQYPLCMEVVEAFNIPALSHRGFEADDVIATLSRLALEWGMEPIILSSDKDLMQLVGEKIHMIDPMRERVFGPEEIRQKLGVGPEGVVDLLALAGDSSDNIPGVAGIGPKTAAKLLDRFGDLDNLLAHADEVGGKRGESLRASRELVLLCRRLVTLRRDLPLDLSPEDLRIGPWDLPRLRALLERFEFSSLLRLLPEPEGDERAQAAAVTFSSADRLGDARYQTLRELGEVEQAVEAARRAGVISIDTETTSRQASRARLVGISLAWVPGEAVYIPLDHRGEGAGEQPPLHAVLDCLRPLLQDPSFPKIGQNHKYDHQVLARYGLDMRGFVGDPMLASYLLAPGARGHGLDALAERHLGHRMISYSEVTRGIGEGEEGEDAAFRMVPVQQATEYAAEDALATLELARLLGEEVEQARMGRLYREVELPMSRVLAKMEARGILLDAKMLTGMSEVFDERLTDLEHQCHELAGREFLVSSPKQLAQVLYDELSLPVTKKTRTSRSTDQGVLQQLRHPLAARVLEYRQVAKLKNTYLDTLPKMVNPETGRLHTSFKQTGTATGRLSSARPNLQNIPVRTEEGRRIREAFVAAPGNVLLSADYSQIELRLLAELASEEVLLEAFNRNEDVHASTAAQLFGLLPGMVSPEQRRAAKAINFGIIYGMSAFRLAREQGITRAKAQRFIDHYFDRYPRIHMWIEENLASARENGYTTTILGRRRYLPGLGDRGHVMRSAAERAARNSPIQGSAADIIKLAMIRLQEKEDEGELPARMLLQVHDELLLEVLPEDVDEAASTTREAMEGAIKLRVPMVVAIASGQSWAEAH